LLINHTKSMPDMPDSKASLLRKLPHSKALLVIYGIYYGQATMNPSDDEKTQARVNAILRIIEKFIQKMMLDPERYDDKRVIFTTILVTDDMRDILSPYLEDGEITVFPFLVSLFWYVPYTPEIAWWFIDLLLDFCREFPPAVERSEDGDVFVNTCYPSQLPPGINRVHITKEDDEDGVNVLYYISRLLPIPCDEIGKKTFDRFISAPPENIQQGLTKILNCASTLECIRNLYIPPMNTPW